MANYSISVETLLEGVVLQEYPSMLDSKAPMEQLEDLKADQLIPHRFYKRKARLEPLRGPFEKQAPSASDRSEDLSERLRMLFPASSPSGDQVFHINESYFQLEDVLTGGFRSPNLG